MSRKIRVIALCTSAAIITVCSTTAATSAPVKPKITLTVFAASSLSSTFTAIGEVFHRNNPTISLRFSFLASSVLASQLADGAPADVFAAASSQDIQNVKRLVSNPKSFATNRIVLAYPSGNRGPVTSFADLNKKSVKWIQCAPSVACGAVTETALKSIGRITTKPVSYEPKVASVVAKLVAGEVDAAFIYHTDYLANKSFLRELVFPDQHASTTKYPVALVTASKNRMESKRFIAAIFSSAGRKILVDAGFGNAG